MKISLKIKLYILILYGLTGFIKLYSQTAAYFDVGDWLVSTNVAAPSDPTVQISSCEEFGAHNTIFMYSDVTPGDNSGIQFNVSVPSTLNTSTLRYELTYNNNVVNPSDYFIITYASNKVSYTLRNDVYVYFGDQFAISYYAKVKSLATNLDIYYESIDNQTPSGTSTTTYATMVGKYIDYIAGNCLAAVNDAFGNQPAGGTTPSVFGNDTSIYSVTPISANTSVTLTNLGGLSGATVNSDGTINIPSNAAPGNYTLTYQICSTESPSTPCVTANVTLTIPSSACYNLANISSPGIDSVHGITLLKRAGSDNGNWPMIRKSAHTVLESNGKAFVITRIAKASIGNITNPIEGMIVYDTTDKCLKVYDGASWKCFSTPACPNN